MSPSTEQRENRALATELKFVVPSFIGEQIRAWAREHLQPDPNATGDRHDTYQITSLYFDTEQFDVFRRKGSYGRSKYRIRRYGTEPIAFLERKLKTRGLVSKRRSTVPMEELGNLAVEDPDRRWKGYWYYQRLKVRRLRLMCEITYRRTARVAASPNGAIRLTVDDDIRTVATQHLAFNGSAHGVPLLEGQMIIELKFRAEIPALFRQMIEKFNLTAQPVSKYRLAMVRLGLVPVSASNLPANGTLDSPVWLTS